MDTPSPKKYSQYVFTWPMVQNALMAAEEGFYHWDLEANEIHYTDRCLKMLGYARTELAPNIFTHPEMTVLEEDRAYFTQEVQRYLQGHTFVPMRIEVRLMKKDSQAWTWIRVNGLATRDEHHRPLALVGAWIDISRRKTAELRAEEESDLFRVLIERIPDNVFFKNRESRFVRANSATAKKLGVPTPSDLIGRKDDHFFDEEMSAISRREELEIMRTGKPRATTVFHEMWLNGQDTWSQTSKYPWFGQDGALKGIVGISTDVTKLVKAEQQVRVTAKKLEAKNRLLEEELELARGVQLALMPKTFPTFNYSAGQVNRTLEFSHIYKPSSGVSGDWFEVMPVGNDCYAAIVYDVMGHGISAALIAFMLRGLFEDLKDDLSRPVELVKSLNKQLVTILSRSGVNNIFASAIYAFIDLRAATITFVSAGHPAPFMLQPDGIASKLALPRGMAMGLLDSAPYASKTFDLLPGMQFMMYTDGIFEVFDAQQNELGVDALADKLSQSKPATVQDMLRNTIRIAAQFGGRDELDDDACLLGLKFS